MIRWIPSFALVLVACGGVSDGKLLSDIDADDAAKLCEEFVKDYPVRTVTCTVAGVEFSVEVGGFADEAECNTDFEPAPAGCAATVGDVRDCFDATINLTDEDLCNVDTEPEIPASCLAISSCYE